MNVLRISLVVFKDIEKSYKLFVVHELSQKTYFAHGGVVDTVSYVLNKLNKLTDLTSNM